MLDMLNAMDPAMVLQLIRMQLAGQDPAELVERATDAIMGGIAAAHAEAGTFAPDGIYFFRINPVPDRLSGVPQTTMPVPLDDFVRGIVYALMVRTALIEPDSIDRLPLATIHAAERLGGVA